MRVQKYNLAVATFATGSMKIGHTIMMHKLTGPKICQISRMVRIIGNLTYCNVIYIIIDRNIIVAEV